MRSGDRPGLQNRRAAGNPVAGGFDPHSLPPSKTRVITEDLHFGAIECARYCASLKAWLRDAQSLRSTFGATRATADTPGRGTVLPGRGTVLLSETARA